MFVCECVLLTCVRSAVTIFVECQRWTQDFRREEMERREGDLVIFDGGEK